jgi:hypothetical protein
VVVVEQLEHFNLVQIMALNISVVLIQQLFDEEHEKVAIVDVEREQARLLNRQIEENDSNVSL